MFWEIFFLFCLLELYLWYVSLLLCRYISDVHLDLAPVEKSSQDGLIFRNLWWSFLRRLGREFFRRMLRPRVRFIMWSRIRPEHDSESDSESESESETSPERSPLTTSFVGAEDCCKDSTQERISGEWSSCLALRFHEGVALHSVKDMLESFWVGVITGQFSPSMWRVLLL